VALELLGAREQLRELVARKLVAGQEVARHQGIVVGVLCWNLFHGRDSPPRARSPLLDDFATFIATAGWDVALLQEAPPRWFRRLCERAHASGVLVRTSRNQFAPLRAWLADRRPDLMRSGEGGSNQILVRAPWRVTARRRLTLAWLPERRRMLWLRLEHDDGAALCVATLHTTAHWPARAAREVDRAARTALIWSEGAPLVFGGDFNVRPAKDPALFERLRSGYGFSGPTAPHAIDHVLARGLDVAESPHAIAHMAGPVRLSDHDPVVARFVG
jgi:endonuclease/exonuclease/phosphatase family metal-dependent hydrolase